MAERNTLSVDDDGEDIPSKDGSETPEPTKRLRKGWKDPKDIMAVGKFKTNNGNIREDF